MPKDEELSEEEVSEEEAPLEESSEEATEETTTEEEPSKEVQKEGYTKERFDGLMSARQKDRTELLELRKEFEALKQVNQPQKKQEDVWMDYLFNKMEEKRSSRKLLKTKLPKLN